MKIAMLLDNPFTEKLPYPKRVYYEAKSLVNLGHDVTIYCKNELDLNLPKDEVMDGIVIRRYFDYFLGTSVLIDKYLDAHIKLYNSIKEEYDVYHCHDTNTWPIGYILSKRDNAKFICETHEYFPDFICKEWHIENILKYELSKKLVLARGNYIRMADKVVVVSQPTGDKLKELYKLQNEPVIIYNTRPLKHKVHSDKNYEIDNIVRKKYSIQDNVKILMFQGIVEVSRGIDVLVKIMKYINNAVLIIAGVDRNNYADELKNIAINEGILDKVIFTGFMPSDELLEYSMCADVLLYFGKPLVENMELTIPNKFFDYILVGKPMIVSDLYSLKQIVEKYEIGEIIDIHNVNIQNISSVVNNFLNNDEKIKEYKCNLEYARKVFSWEEQEKKLFKMYDELNL
ncbi:glycosyltransferase family 4 protein [Clostridium sp. JS66]|uniref:glycosyltransferase family 4 protein n=1 Tax=Clostridium sp. JS66 TaxID=3064705 RepID=UPI00298E3C4B|nr:glycosyltransferase family 4 protein [Clostridium sp. JS66]WPC41023.1 glycosyltransferase family 4 protein [Clostridium sp. JS66]